jgi:adenylyl-sulfate kinase
VLVRPGSDATVTKTSNFATPAADLGLVSNALGMQGFTLWLTGLSGAGKSTLARSLEPALARYGRRVEVLDGDECRRHLSPELGYTKTDRDTNIKRIGFIAHLLSRNGIVAIVAAISPYREARDWVRSLHKVPFIEVFVECPMEVLIERDPKSLYARARRGLVANLTGVSDPYEPPEKPEITLHTALEPVGESCARIVRELERRRLIEPAPRRIWD